MKFSKVTIWSALVAFAALPVTATFAQLDPSGATASWLGSLPPQAKSDISAGQQAELEKELAAAREAFLPVKGHPRAADVEIFLKAVRYALDFHEWYDKTPEDGVKKARDLLAEAGRRTAALKEGLTPWMEGAGSKVLGFYSRIDDSPQPYGVEIPEGLEWGPGKKPVPMWIWLHGRGDTATDLHFIASRMKSKGGEFKPKSTIVVHPFGRYCNGYKSAGETDVLECGADATQRFGVDVNRIALLGFSMGGAGAWHMGAHYADQWAAVHTGAGFVDVKRYQKLTPDRMPVWYEQTLWGLYDVPDYARNFFNVPLISYSGEEDKQRDSAEYMTEVLAKEGIALRHLIGPKIGHKYDPAVRDEVSQLMEKHVERGRNPFPNKVWLQTKSARYARKHWVRVLEVAKPWEDTRLDADLDASTGILRLVTKNVDVFAVDVPWPKAAAERTMVVDGQMFTAKDTRKFSPGLGNTLRYFGARSETGVWTISGNDDRKLDSARKAGGTCIDDAFLKRFVVVLPDKPGRSPQTDAWVKAESEHFIQRWRRLMRGDPIVAKASDVGAARAEDEHLILWGDDKSNECIAARSAELPVRWDSNNNLLLNNGLVFDATKHVPIIIYPDQPYKPGRPYVVLNSGLTFREAHDKTNSLQNPKLPDWAVVDITTAADAEKAGKVVDAGFFDKFWRFSAPQTGAAK